MRFVLEFVLLLGGIGLIAFTVSFLYSFWSKKRELKNKREEEMWKELRNALSSNSKQRLEDVLILHSKSLPKEIKPVIQSRIDDLIINDLDEKLENVIRENNK